MPLVPTTATNFMPSDGLSQKFSDITAYALRTSSTRTYGTSQSGFCSVTATKFADMPPTYLFPSSCHPFIQKNRSPSETSSE